MRVAVILPAAGLGTRMGKGTAEKAGTSRKQFMLLDVMTPDASHKVFDEAAETGAAIVAVPAVDTVKQVTRGTTHVLIRATLPREKLVMAQTPQVFRYDLLVRAFEAARLDGFIGTDESSMVERLDVEVS